MFPFGLLHTDERVLNVRLEPINNSSVQTQDVVYRTCRMRWTIETNREGESGKSVLVAWHDDDIIYELFLFHNSYLFLYIFLCFFLFQFLFIYIFTVFFLCYFSFMPDQLSSIQYHPPFSSSSYIAYISMLYTHIKIQAKI